MMTQVDKAIAEYRARRSMDTALLVAAMLAEVGIALLLVGMVVVAVAIAM